MSENEKIIDKIKKCLSLSKSSNENEAATAMRQAQALMEKHGINSEQVELSDVKIASAKGGRAQRTPVYHHQLISLICDAFGVDSIISIAVSYKTCVQVRFIGIGCQAELAAYAHEVLYRQLIRDRLAYLKTLKRLKKSNKSRKADIFAQAWVTSVSDRVNTFAQSDKNANLIKRFKGQEFPDLVASKPKRHKSNKGDWSAITAGFGASDNITLNHAMNETEQRRLQ